MVYLVNASRDTVIDVADLRMVYGHQEVLRGVDVRIRAGEVVVLLGPNGAGKTTTIEVLEGFRAPTAGSVLVLGERPLAAGQEWRARVGVVLQSWRDHPKWRVRELVYHLGEFYRPYATAARPRPWPWPMSCSSGWGWRTSPTDGSAPFRAASDVASTSPRRRRGPRRAA